MKRGLFAFFVGLVISSVFGTVFMKLQPTHTKTVYYLQVGVYETYDNALKMKDRISEAYMYQKENLHYVICGITTNQEDLKSTEEMLANESINYIQKEIVLETNEDIEETLLEVLQT